MHDFSNLSGPEKIPTGIEGFDKLTKGGLIEGRTTLLVGTSGSGKTLLSVELLYRGITEFERNGVFLTFEERPIDVVRNVKHMGWDLGELVNHKKLSFVDASPGLVQTVKIGDYDLEALMTRVMHAIETTHASLLAIDSVRSLFSQFQDPSLIRRELFRLIDQLREKNITTLMTAERLDEHGRISRYGIEEFVADSVIILRNVLEAEKVRRTAQVLKMRGDSHMKGEFPFTISEQGISIFPLAAMELAQKSSNERVGTGSTQLDKMTNGGIFRDSIYLVSGPTGGGKTLMSTQFTAEACSQGERVLLLAFEESREQLFRNAKSWGVDFEKLEARNRLKIVCNYPEAMALEDHLLFIRREIEVFNPHRLVVDSVSAMERVATVRNFREFVIGLTSYVKQKRICSLFTSTTPQLSGGESVTETHISTITDVIVLLRYVEINGALRRGIAVIKMRGSQHDKDVHEFTIDDKGLHIGNPFRNVQNILLGIPSSIGLSESAQLEGMFK
jgi:circadian clock protein KaiC